MDFKKNATIFICSNLIVSTVLLAQDISIKSIGVNAGYSKMFYTSEKIDIDKPKTSFYNLELYTIINHLFDNNHFRPTINYIYSKNDAIDSNSFFIGVNRYDNFKKFDFYTGILLGYSELKWEYSSNEPTYSNIGPTGGFQVGMEFPFTKLLQFNVNTKYMLYQRTVDLQPEYDVKFTHTGTLSLSFGIKYLFGLSAKEKESEIYYIATDDGSLNISVPADDTEGIESIDKALDESIDSDNDGIPDMLDNCSDSVKGEIVDELGCAKDSDDDFVLDRVDKCLNSVENEIVDEYGCAKDSDNDGIVDRLDRCIDSVAGEIVDEYGCAKDSDNDTIFDRVDKCPNSKEFSDIDNNGCSSEDKQYIKNLPILTKKIQIKKIKKQLIKPKNFTLRFEYKSDKLEIDSEKYIQDIIANLKKFKKNRLIIRSYTDSIGSKKYNLKLSAKRSQTILDILQNKGIEKKRIAVYNLGESSPIASNMTKEGRAKNRRVEIEIIAF